MIEVANRTEQISIEPNIVRDYTKGLAGVDRVDRMLSCYSAMRKTLRLYKKNNCTHHRNGCVLPATESSKENIYSI